MLSKPYAFPDACIQIFCKAPIAGEVKTRLAPELSAEQACAVHRDLTMRTLKLVSELSACPIELYAASALQHPFFSDLKQQFACDLYLQQGEDLGLKMHQALASGLRHYQQVILIGCDCPSLSRDVLLQALNALSAGYEAVLAPTEDGGYSLIGMRSPQLSLFKDMHWSTATVMAETRLRLTEQGLKTLELPMQWDVDTYADYLRYKKLLALEAR